MDLHSIGLFTVLHKVAERILVDEMIPHSIVGLKNGYVRLCAIIHIQTFNISGGWLSTSQIS